MSHIEIDLVPMGGWEQRFSLAFPVANGAVYRAISLHASQHLDQPVKLRESAGVAHYQVWLAQHVRCWFYVLDGGEADTGESHTLLSAHPLIPRGAQLSEANLAHLEGLVINLWMEIERAIRFHHPEYGARPLRITPTMPLWADGPSKVFAWHTTYAAEMTDKELARLAHVSYSTLRNERSRLGLHRAQRKGQRPVNTK